MTPNTTELEKATTQLQQRLYTGDGLASDKIKEALTTYAQQAVEGEQTRIVDIITTLQVKNETASCPCKNPLTIDSNNYDCSDIHIGYKEATSDIISEIDPLKDTKD